MGVSKTIIQVPGNVFIKDRKPFISVDQETKEIFVVPGSELNDFYKELDLRGGDIITAVNDTNYNLDNIYDLIMASQAWKNGASVSVKIKRGAKEMTLTGKTKLPMENKTGYEARDVAKSKLREAWLKG